MDNIRITIDTNAADAAKTFEQLSKSFDDSTKSSEDLRKQIKGLKDELYKLTPGTEEYGQVLQDLGGKMDQLSDTSQELRVATGGLDAVFQSTTNATATMAAGFTAVTGVVSLFGGESEDLQKTFVKLQAVMAIMTGLKGFAGFAKITKQASTSLKAYIAQMTLARKATMQQTSATTTLATTETIATGATKGLAVGFKSLTAAIASNPIGALLVALTAAIAVITRFNEKSKEAAERQEEYNRAVGNTPPPVKTADEAIQDYLNTLEKYDQKLQAIGVSEERRNEIRREQLEEQIRLGEQQLKYYKDAVEKQQEFEKSGDAVTVAVLNFVKSLNKEHESFEELQTGAIDTEKALKSLREELEKLTSGQLPQSMQTLNNTLSDLSDVYRVKIAGGLATQGDYLQAQIKVYQDAYNDLWEIVGGGGTHASRKIKGAGTEEGNLNKELATRYQAQIKALQVDLDVYNAGLQKKANDAAKNAADAINKNYKKLTDDINEKVIEYKEAWRKVLEQFQNLGGLTDGDDLQLNESIGRAITQMNRYSMDLEIYLDEWKKTAEKALRAGEITQSKYEQFEKFLSNIKDSLGTDLLGMIDTQISTAVLDAGKNIQNLAEGFKKDNDAMLSALSGGLVSKEEYVKFLEARIKDYREALGPEIENAMKLIDEEIANAAPKDQGRLREIMTAYIQSADDIIPPSVLDAITTTLKSAIDKQFDQLETEYQYRMGMFESWFADQNRSWLEGGTNTSYWGDSASTTFKKAQEQADELYKLLHEEYTQEAAMLQEKMQALDENSEAYAQYYAKLNELRDADAAAQAAHETASLANAREYAQNIMQTAGQFGDAISGLAGAMGSYYAEQAEQAKEMYGENSEEYKKYLKKEGNMKIAQVWVDAATGIMSAWATSESLGPIAGPILAAIQTAALLATAVASTQQIKRQTQANASGGASTANVSGITDRVVFGEAQNADQQAQLNAEYNQGATRVFVTEGDINNAQGNTRTAVTNNTF
ncbi:MAG: hypothetical protein II305_03605 [Clostridia bacterium]|nr:hypothetical protein [Clostridia bacterium]